MIKRTLYLANPYGFAPSWKNLLLPAIVSKLESMNIEVLEPFSRNNQIANKPGWAKAVGKADILDVRNSDGLLAVCNMNPPDEGVMVELGIAIALNHPTFIFRDDFRHCTDSEDYPLNLMLFTGIPENEYWKDYYYTSIDELSDNTKALARFARWEL